METADSVSEEKDVMAEPELDMDEAQRDVSESLFGKDVVDTEGKVEDPLDEDVEAEPEEEKDETEEKPEEEKDETEDESDDLPASWKKDMKEAWDKTDPQIKAYVKLREEQMKNGIEVAKDDAQMGRTLRDVIKPYEKLMQENNVEPINAIGNLMALHAKLAQAGPEERKQEFLKLAQGYGVNLSGEQVDPVVQSIKQELDGIKQHLTVSQQKAQQAEAARIESEVNDFAEKHEYFDELSDDIAIYIKAGLDLPDAYEKALWANPVTRAKENQRLLDEEAKKAQAKSKQEVEAAKKAKATNVRKRDTDKAPTASKGTIDDTLEQTFREIKSRDA